MQEFSELISLAIMTVDGRIINRYLNMHVNKSNDSKAMKMLYLSDSFNLSDI